MAVVFVFVALLVQSADRATTTTITTNNPQVQPGVRLYSSNDQRQPATTAPSSKARLYVTTITMY